MVNAFPDPKRTKHAFGRLRIGYASARISSIRKVAAMSAADVEHDERNGTADGSTQHGSRTTLNWVLALLTIPGAIAVVAYSYLQVLSTASCTQGTCTRLGPGEDVFGLIMYGSPVVAAAAIALSFFTARRARGFLVPVIAWAILVIAAAILALTFIK
jgi:hypothetical protein